MDGKAVFILIGLLLLTPITTALVPTVGDLDVCGLYPSYGTNTFYSNGFLRNTYFLNDTTTSTTTHDALLLEPDVSFPDTDSVTLTSADGLKLIDRYVTPIGNPSVVLIKGSEWRFFNYVTVDSASGSNHVVIVGKLMLADGSLGKEFVNTTSEVIILTSTPQYTQTRAAVGRMYVNSTDRIAVEYYGRTTSAASRTLTLYHGGTEYSTHFSTYT